MPTSLIVAFFLLVLIYVAALVYAVLLDPRFGAVTGLAGLVVFVFVLISQACLTRGGCHFLAWIYVLLYLAALLTLLFLTAILVVARYRDHPSISWARERMNGWVARRNDGGIDEIDDDDDDGEMGRGRGGGGPAGPLWNDPLGPPRTASERTHEDDDDGGARAEHQKEEEEEKEEGRSSSSGMEAAPDEVQNHAFTQRRQERVRRMLEERRARED